MLIKQNSEEMLVDSLARSKGKVESSLDFAGDLSVGSVNLCSVLPKSKRTVHAQTLFSSNARNNFSPDNCRGNKTAKESRKGMRHRIRAKLSEMPKKLQIQENSFKRRLWTIEEDQAITSLVEQHGIRKWTLISKKLQEKFHIYGRSGKQCRERLVSILPVDGTII